MDSKITETATRNDDFRSDPITLEYLNRPQKLFIISRILFGYIRKIIYVNLPGEGEDD